MKNRYKHIKVKTGDGIAVLTFNRPDQLNAMNREMMDEIISGIEGINSDAEVRIAVIRGEGRAFMAGADIVEYGSQTAEQFDSFQVRGVSLYKAIENAPIPWIAAVNGFALGGGFEIALACDIIMATTESKMGLPEVFLNLVPGGGGTQRLIQKIGINRAKEMLLTGGQYPAETLMKWGIVNYVFDADDFDLEVRRFAEKMVRRPKDSLKHLKRLAQLSLKPIPFEDKLEEERSAVSELFYSEEAKKRIQDFIDN